MADENEGYRQAILEDILSGYEEGYRVLNGDWQDLDRKAQAMAAVAGVFVGGILALLRDGDNLPSALPRLLLLGATGSLLSSIGYLLRVLRTRTVPSPVFGRHLEALGRPVLDLGKNEISVERHQAFLWDQIISWRSIETILDEAKRDKAKNLWVAQVLLSLGIFLIATLGVARLLLETI